MGGAGLLELDFENYSVLWLRRQEMNMFVKHIQEACKSPQQAQFVKRLTDVGGNFWYYKNGPKVVVARVYFDDVQVGQATVNGFYNISNGEWACKGANRDQFAAEVMSKCW